MSLKVLGVTLAVVIFTLALMVVVHNFRECIVHEHTIIYCLFR